ncbi:MAG TPA: DUF4339 domain-containing protein [Bryobacteraceae bacterium]|nr:DUF4339 domain-containing protein [Bryobacteraceae bacterium]
MNYYISRDGQQFGPYTLAEVQRYVADGNILLTDLAHSEGMASWVPVSQILGNIPPQQPVTPGPTPNYGQVPMYQQPGPMGQVPMAGQPGPGPLPPDLHWAVLLVIAVFCGIFTTIWMFVQANFVKKLKPDFNGLTMYILAVVGLVIGYIIMIAGVTSREDALQAFGGLILLGSVVFFIIGHFSIKSALEEYYNSVEPIGLRLSGVMVFFFNVFYFQYHFNRIRQWKTTGVLPR